MDYDISQTEDLLITASLDGTSNIIETIYFEIVKSFKPEKPTRNINACKFIPNLLYKTDDYYSQKFHAVISGGQDSRNVTNTNAKEGGFDLEFLNIVTGETVASVKGHFGPVNTLAFSGNGKLLASGGEDSVVRVQLVTDDTFDKYK